MLLCPNISCWAFCMYCRTSISTKYVCCYGNISFSIAACWFVYTYNSLWMTAAEIFLWRDKKVSAGVLGFATVIWALFELLQYHLLTLVCHILIVAITVLFLWSNASAFINTYVSFCVLDLFVRLICTRRLTLKCYAPGLHLKFQKLFFLGISSWVLHLHWGLKWIGSLRSYEILHLAKTWRNSLLYVHLFLYLKFVVWQLLQGSSFFPLDLLFEFHVSHSIPYKKKFLPVLM